MRDKQYKFGFLTYEKCIFWFKTFQHDLKKNLVFLFTKNVSGAPIQRVQRVHFWGEKTIFHFLTCSFHQYEPNMFIDKMGVFPKNVPRALIE